MNRLQRAINGERIEKEHNDKRLFTSQSDFILSKEDLLTIRSLGEFKHIEPAEILKEYEEHKALNIKSYLTKERIKEADTYVEGYNQGHDDGRENGHEAGREDGYNDGFRDGVASIEDKLNKLLNNL